MPPRREMFVHSHYFVIEGEKYASGQEKVATNTWFSSAKIILFQFFCLVNIVIFISYHSSSSTSPIHSAAIFKDGERESFLMPRAARPCTWSKPSHMKCCELLLPLNWTKEKRARENAVETSKVVKRKKFRWICECLSVKKMFIVKEFGKLRNAILNNYSFQLLHHKIN